MNEIENIAKQACAMLDQKKAENIVLLNISKLTIIADYFIICSAKNAILTKALYDDLEEKMAQMQRPILRSEGYQQGKWIVMDFSDIIVHIFHEPEREFYHLERLWDDGVNRVPLHFIADDPGLLV